MVMEERKRVQATLIKAAIGDAGLLDAAVIHWVRIVRYDWCVLKDGIFVIL